ncbi:MAG: hypothetical protein IPJ76_15275 [Flavobacteriales bacterium]|nr:MAG: hypothetical protein IPJ76_15275 [Flavobacteriales bacterium]
MKELYCWRCKMVVPMLDDTEFAEAKRLYGLMFKPTGPDFSREARAKPLLDYYNALTGFAETEPNAIMHHALSMHGPLCSSCGKPYRTPAAKVCAACGHLRAGDE